MASFNPNNPSVSFLPLPDIIYLPWTEIPATSDSSLALIPFKEPHSTAATEPSVPVPTEFLSETPPSTSTPSQIKSTMSPTIITPAVSPIECPSTSLPIISDTILETPLPTAASGLSQGEPFMSDADFEYELNHPPQSTFPINLTTPRETLTPQDAAVFRLIDVLTDEDTSATPPILTAPENCEPALDTQDTAATSTQQAPVSEDLSAPSPAQTPRTRLKRVASKSKRPLPSSDEQTADALPPPIGASSEPSAKRVKTSSKKKPFVSQTSQPFDPRFTTPEAILRYANLCTRQFIAERNVDFDSFEKTSVLDFLTLHSLRRALSYASDFSPSLVREFYANLNRADLVHRRVFIRGKYITFSSTTINAFLERENWESGVMFKLQTFMYALTNGVYTDWDDELQHPLSQATLASEFYALLTISKANWLPTKSGHGVSWDTAQLLCRIGANYEVNFGRLIFNEIVRWADMSNIKGNKFLPYPCLIFSIIQSQGDVLAKGEPLQPPGPVIKWNSRWMDGAHRPILYEPLHSPMTLLVELGIQSAPTEAAEVPRVPDASSIPSTSASSSASFQARLATHLRAQLQHYNAQIHLFQRLKQDTEALLSEL